MADSTIPSLAPGAPLSPHVTKRLFRSLLPRIASYWAQASAGRPEDTFWPSYERLLLACQQVLDQAPMHPNEAAQANIERRLECALELLATTLGTVLPGGLPELGYYQLDEWHLAQRHQAEALRRRSMSRRRKSRARNAKPQP
jgi:hypothetical protein